VWETDEALLSTPIEIRERITSNNLRDSARPLLSLAQICIDETSAALHLFPMADSEFFFEFVDNIYSKIRIQI
jgi:hypothetical protein